MDNLDVLRGMNSETVDLIATDPPFNKKRNRASSSGQYEDAWRWSDHPTMAGKRPDQWKWQPVHREWLDEIKDANPSLFQVIESTCMTQDDDTAAFLCFLSVRLLEMHRILTPSGNLFLHCDHSANAYIRMCLDAIFGSRNFVNEIAWLRKSEKHNLATRRFPQIHDTIYYYTKKSGRERTHNVQTTPYSDEHLTGNYKHRDERGVYATFPCTNEKGGNKVYKFRGVTRAWRWEPERMEAMYQADMLTQATPTSPFRYKKYLADAEGVKVSDLWTDVSGFQEGEQTGSPDQKPVSAYERIVLAGSKEGDLVLDPFAGCATTVVAARRHNRRWVGIDRRRDAKFHVACRLAGISQDDAEEARKLPHLDEWLGEQLCKHGAHYYTEPPIRSDLGDTAAPRLGPVYSVHRKTIFTHDEMKLMLIAEFGHRCWGCRFESGIYGDRAGLYLELDHINPKSAGGHDELDNRALLCGPCNRSKSDKKTLSSLRQTTMRAAAKDHPIDLAVASGWCRDRLMEEIRNNPQLAV